MKPAESVSAFESFAEANEVSLIAITPSEGFTQMFAFYEAVAAEGCTAPSCDMLLFQWGTYDWGEGKNYEVNITRQFIEDGTEDDPTISQLQLTFSFPPTLATSTLGEGNRWCEGHAHIAAFRSFVLSSLAFQSIADQDPPGVSLRHSYV